MKKEEKIRHYMKFLPQQITVYIEKNIEGEEVWAKIEEMPNCYTQASNMSEFPTMLTDAVFTYCDVPEKYRGALGLFSPLPHSQLWRLPKH